ncbi:MAG: hypothetical protein KBD60_02155 [Sterolibacterium sp.]|jgi:hypothetical protein|nr:hypothetical protein [Sterolibacterium sp.]
MKKTTPSELPLSTRYHLPGRDGLYTPIPFLFVTERMHQEITRERQHILDSLPAERRERQNRLFERYNPQHSSTAFNAMLRLFNPGEQ